ncbi:MAG TPA: cytochrome ubiquinol oxidase subunit I [Bryobacterales bacterium]|jgi:cytochrome d ubiquinol oxidase subunit I|nr:cytochrome ubiquinol oxidase subunit I [Bryobacterales bacterium]
MDDAYFVHRIHFAFTIIYHYIFPQLTMGLAPLIVALKTLSLRSDRPAFGHAARFWTKIFGINFLAGVVTGIPMEFQFGTNWARFSQWTGGVIAQPVAMEGVFSFFLESAFLGLFLFGEKRLSRAAHWAAGFLVFLGSWLSGFFIVAANAWMQHPVAYKRLPEGTFEVTSFWGLLGNPWALIQFAHTMSGAVVTGALVMSAVGAFYLLNGRHAEYGRIFVCVGVIAGFAASVFQIFPSGDMHGRYMAHAQPVTTAAMEALFRTEAGAPMVILGQPNIERRQIDNPILVNKALSFLIYGTTRAEVQGLDHFPEQDWPTNIPLLFFSYHVMAGLGTLFVAVTAVALGLLWKGALFETRWMLWILMLAFPFPYIANTAGWLTAEAGRQPWLVYGLVRTQQGFSRNVSAANGLFTLLGFMGLYALLSILLLFLLERQIEQGPETESSEEYLPASISGGGL